MAKSNRDPRHRLPARNEIHSAGEQFAPAYQITPWHRQPAEFKFVTAPECIPFTHQLP
jgi:hypothetical protein